jgi:ABC-type bacteriocin/lantibiotic exporter with double-glycine peptidase domain
LSTENFKKLGFSRNYSTPGRRKVSATLRRLSILVARAGAGIIHDIRYDLFSHLQKLAFSFFDSRPHGKIFVRVVPYVNSVSDALSNGIINFIIEVLNIVFIIFFMFKVSPELATVAVLGLPLFAILSGASSPPNARHGSVFPTKTPTLTPTFRNPSTG